MDPCTRCQSNNIYFVGWTNDSIGETKWLPENVNWVPVFKCEDCYREWTEIGMTDSEIEAVRDGRNHFNTNKISYEIYHQRGGISAN